MEKIDIPKSEDTLSITLTLNQIGLEEKGFDLAIETLIEK